MQWAMQEFQHIMRFRSALYNLAFLKFTCPGLVAATHQRQNLTKHQVPFSLLSMSLIESLDHCTNLLKLGILGSNDLNLNLIGYKSEAVWNHLYTVQLFGARHFGALHFARRDVRKWVTLSSLGLLPQILDLQEIKKSRLLHSSSHPSNSWRYILCIVYALSIVSQCFTLIVL